MKKSGGYVIIYVVFVILFLCIVAAGTCTAALNTIKTQNAAVKQLQDRYTAEGNVEQYMAEVCVFDAALCGDDYETIDGAMVSAKAAFASTVADSADVNRVGFGVWVDNGSEYKVSLVSSCGSTRVSAEAAFRAIIEIIPYQKGTGEYDEQNNEIMVPRFAYSVFGATCRYISYRLESDGGEAE